ncbi:MAG TPA: 50S ribosomal protein L23 [Candidatus Saccharimonadales bacterium]|nr:50S ribosomal protein L23 [Candidatus Saccharimonadales bacterium]
MSQLVLIPRVSEKSIAMAERQTYVFEVPTSSNKIQVAEAVEQAFKVKVAKVNMLIAKGKTVNWRRGAKRTPGRRSDIKKAMVTLQKGHKIGLFEEGK